MSDPIILRLDGEDARSGAELWLGWAKRAEWKFSSYYKYDFTFTASGELLIMASDQAEKVPFAATATAGGDASDIYRWQVADPMTWEEICEPGEPALTVRSEGGVLFSTNAYLMGQVALPL